MKPKAHMTVAELMAKAAELAKADPLFEDAAKQCALDYGQVGYGVGSKKLTHCSFDAVGAVTFGGSEGIYGAVDLVGVWSDCQNDLHRAFSMKTLETTKEAFIGMGTLANLMAYYAMQVVRENLDRFS